METVQADCKRRTFELADGREMDCPGRSSAFVGRWRILNEAQGLEQGQRVAVPT